MKIHVSQQLDPICETLGLMMVSQNYNMLMEKSIRELNENGVHGERFIKKHLKIVDKYVQEFNRHKKIEKPELFEVEDDQRGLFIFISFLIIKNDWIKNDLDAVHTDDLRKMILQSIDEVFEIDLALKDIQTMEEILETLKTIDMDMRLKWKLLLILQNPRVYFQDLIDAVCLNRDAYHKAYQMIEKQLPKYIADLTKYIETGNFDFLSQLKNRDMEVIEVIPTMAFIASVFEVHNFIYAGLLFEVIYNEQLKAMGNKGELVFQLKAIADKSKLEILTLIKNTPKYSQEISDALNLTPATVSYHMATLFESKFVCVEKKNGKVYYSLNEESIEKFIEQLNRTLL